MDECSPTFVLDTGEEGRPDNCGAATCSIDAPFSKTCQVVQLKEETMYDADASRETLEDLEPIAVDRCPGA